MLALAKRLLVTADATKNKMLLVGNMAKQVLAAKGVAVEFDIQLLSTVKAAEITQDLIILFGTSQKLVTSIPIVSGVSFLTRIGMEKAADEIIQKLNLKG